MSHKYVAFFTGLLLGTALVGYISVQKQRVKMEREAHDPVAHLRVEGFLPGQMRDAREPIMGDFALFDRQFEPNELGVYDRVIIDQRAVGEPIFRYLEKLWRDPESGRVYLISRQKMHADEVVVRMRADVEPAYAEAFLSEAGFNVIDTRGERIYVVKIRGHGPMAVPKTVDIIEQLGWPVEAAIPHYEREWQ